MSEKRNLINSKAAEDPHPKCLRCEKLFQGKKNLKVHILKMHEIVGEWTVDNPIWQNTEALVDIINSREPKCLLNDLDN